MAYVFDETKAARAVKFIQALTHTKGKWAGTRFELIPWQEELIKRLFGFVDESGNRQYRTCYCEIPKKNGKSEIAAALALKLLVADGEESAEVYGAAADRDQASIVFHVAAQMIRNNPILDKRLKIVDSQKRIIDPIKGGLYRALSAEAYTKHGFSASGVIFDELHTQPTRELWDVLTLGSGDAREQQLIFAITTAGFDRQSICWEQHEYARRILEGTIDDPAFLPIVYGVDENASWEDEGEWVKVNPSLGHILKIENIRSQYNKARETPALQNAFRQLRLNQWTQQANRAIDIQVWNENSGGGPLDEDHLLQKRCFGGLDLATVNDLTAWVMVFPDDNDPELITLLARFWCPEKRLKDPQNKYRDSYQVWAKQGYLAVTPGEATDYGMVKKRILDDAKLFKLVDMNVDRLFQAHQLSTELQDEGVTVVGMGMGFVSFAAPMQEFFRRLTLRKIIHGNNPVLRFCADNLAVATDAAGNMKPDKASSQGKIDGIVAGVLGLDRCMRHVKKTSVYERRGIASIG